MNAKMVLLPVAEARPVQEAQVWFKDGLRLLRMRLAQWTTYSVLTVFVLVLVAFVGDSLIAATEKAGGGMLGHVALFAKLVLMNLATIATHGGMFLGMTRVVQGGAVRIHDMSWLFSAVQRRHLLVLAILLSVCSLGYALLEERLFAGQNILVPDAKGPYVVDGKVFNINQELLMRMGMLFACYTLLMSVLTWAVLPLMTLFADVPLGQALRYNFDGLRKNIAPLLYLSLLMLLAYFAVGLVAGLLATTVPLLLLPFAAVVAVWALPLNNAWVYSAFRHVYTDW